MTKTKRHDRLWSACKTLPGDYAPWGEIQRWNDPADLYPDCSGGCRFFIPLFVESGPDGEGYADADWGVCTNPQSHRHGLLTFEHQGCQKAS